jgi:hypothetical protein
MKKILSTVKISGGIAQDLERWRLPREVLGGVSLTPAKLPNALSRLCFLAT